MNRLRELREDHDLFQKDIAKYLNMSQTGYSQYETETNDIPTEILKKLADYYEVSVDYLLYRTDIREPYKKSAIYSQIKESSQKN
jgi:transcriptional regulator with XRE-family HTH domain